MGREGGERERRAASAADQTPPRAEHGGFELRLGCGKITKKPGNHLRSLLVSILIIGLSIHPSCSVLFSTELGLS